MHHIFTEDFKMEGHPLPPTLSSLRRELSGYAQLSRRFTEVLKSIIEPTPDEGVSTDAQEMLQVWLRYAYEGWLPAAYQGRPQDLEKNSAKFQELCVVQQAFSSFSPSSGLTDLLQRVRARVALDTQAELSVADLTLLSNMSERSVRNAISAGELALLSNGLVSHAAGAQWLQGRRSFVPTRVEGATEDALPEQLQSSEIPGFIRRRMERVWGPFNQEQAPQELLQAAFEVNLSLMDILQAMEPHTLVAPQDCIGLAKLMRVDSSWFTYQVMRSIFPEQMAMFKPKSEFFAQAPSEPSFVGDTLTVTLTEAMLQNGYLDMPAQARELFPPDAFGDRASSAQSGRTVALHFGSNTAHSDIRLKSSKTMSPRKRFNAWFNTTLGAKPGDKIEVKKVGDREYQLTHHPV